MRFLYVLLGPRIPNTELSAHPVRYALPTLAISLARVCLLVSLFLPYWHIKLKAPQYPRRDLQINAYINRVEGDLREINGLNHYIGMRKLDEAAQFEKAVGVWGLIALVLLMESAMFIHSRWAALLLLPVILFPAFFLLDLHYWLNLFGQNLDPKAPLSSSIKPFTPPALGEGVIGQFKTIAWQGYGLWLAWAAAALSVVGLVLHRRAYMPLYEAMKKKARDTSTPAPDTV
jgi:copper chaperone NosL